MKFFRACVLAMAGFGVGCAVRSPLSRMGEAGVVPGGWSATREARSGVDQHWVRGIGGGELVALVDEAQRANPILKASAARVEQAAALAKWAGADRFPSLGAGAQAIRQKQNFIGLPGGGGSSTSRSFGVSLDAAWELDLWGRVRAGAEAAGADAEAGLQADRALRASLAGQVAKAWLAVAESNEQVVLAERAVKSRAEAALLVRERFERAIADDGGSAAQVRLSETEWAASKSELERRRGERERALRQLELLLGRYPSGHVAGSARLPKLPPVPPAGLPSELLLRRPDVLAAERRLSAAGRRSEQAAKALYPSIRLSGGLGGATDELGEILGSSAGVWSLGAGLTQPLFQGGKLRAGVQRVDAEEREAAANLQRIVLDAFGEVEQALVAEAHLRRQEVELARAVELSREAAQRADEEFRDGTGGVLTYLAARDREVAAAAAWVALRGQLLANRVQLHLALGGDVVLHDP